MCWVTDELPELKIAEKDITTLKVVLKKDNVLLPYFQYNNFYYKLDELSPLIALEPYSHYNHYFIEVGYHSYSESCLYEISSDYIEIANCNIYQHNYARFNLSSCCLVSCIIPKGTKYYVNERDEYVSEQIIIKNIIGETSV